MADPKDPASQTSTQRQRASKRISVTLPLLIRGRDIHGAQFEDTASSHNVSREGASFVTRRELRVGQQLEVIVRRHMPGRPPGAGDFETTADVLRILPQGEGEWEVGVHFTGPRFRTYMPETA